MADFEENLTNLLECPVCLNRLIPPVRTCEKGHAICRNCKERVSQCPVCRGEFWNTKDTMLDKIINAIPMLCRHNGCTEKLLADNVADHEAICDYREVCCYNEMCIGRFRVCNLDKHFNKYHPEANEMELSQAGRFTVYKRSHLSSTPIRVASTSVLLYMPRENIYFLWSYTVNMIEKIFYTGISYIGKAKDALKYIYEIKIDQGLNEKNNCYFIYNSICMPYVENTKLIRLHPSVIVLDVQKIFLSNDYQKNGFTIDLTVKEIVNG